MPNPARDMRPFARMSCRYRDGKDPSCEGRFDPDMGVFDDDAIFGRAVDLCRSL